jgi:hypothetical protein
MRWAEGGCVGGLGRVLVALGGREVNLGELGFESWSSFELEGVTTAAP